MEELWARSEATVREVQEALNARAEKVRAYTTLLTVMTRLDGKGLLVRRRAGRLDVYSPALSRDAYLQARAEAEVRALVEDFGDLALAHFARHVDRLDAERLDRLRKLAGVSDFLRRAEFAVAAFGATAFLLALLFVLDAVRFHGDVLVATVEGLPRGELHGRGLLLLTLALFDLLALARALRCVGRGVAAHRRVLARMPVLERRSSAGGRSRSCRGRARWRSARACCARACTSPAARWSGSPGTRWRRSSSTRRITRGAATPCGSWSRARSARPTR